MKARGHDDLDDLFRRESGKMTAALTRVFGLHNLPLVEDVVHDALCRALEVWKFSGVPRNPAAWLVAAAKNRAVDVLRRERTARAFGPELEAALRSEASIGPAVDEVFESDALRDEELRMMFACCHARLPDQTQVALMLNLLGGFGAREIAAAFLSSEAATEKRLQRGKQVLAASPGLLGVTAERVSENLGAVHGALYLLFNEGYHGNHPDQPVREELCAEAIRLASLLAGSQLTATPATHALLALMLLSAARLGGRVDSAGELLPLSAQDRSLWDRDLIARGRAALDASATGDELTDYHLEAGIALVHALAETHASTDWAQIVALYDLLLARRPSPVVALSRAIAIGELRGPERALEAIGRIEAPERLLDYPFYAAAMAELHLRAGHPDRARQGFRDALAKARSPAEARFLERRLEACRG